MNLIDKIFTKEVLAKIDPVVAKYETRRAPMLEVLHMLQEHYGHISLEMEEATAEYLKVSPMDVREVVTFYTLYYTKPKAQVRFNVCRTLTCNLLGAENIVKCFEKHLGIKSGSKTPDGKIEVKEVECLGACELAPMLQLNDDEYFGHLNEAKVAELIRKANQQSNTGGQSSGLSSIPNGSY